MSAGAEVHWALSMTHGVSRTPWGTAKLEHGVVGALSPYSPQGAVVPFISVSLTQRGILGPS